MQRNTYLKSLQSSLHEILAEDSQVFLLGEDIADPYGGAFKVTQGLSGRFPDRVLCTPICEASIVGIGTGLALRGRRAIVEIMFGDFITIACDQLVNHAAKFSQISCGGIRLSLVIRTPMGGGRGYGPSHSQSLERLFFGVPGLSVVAPSHYHDPGRALRQALYRSQPTLFVEHKLLYPCELITGESLFVDLGFDVVIVRNFDPAPNQEDVVVLAYGGVSRFLQEIMDELAMEEVRVTAVLPSLVSHVSEDLVQRICRLIDHCGRVVIVEEGCEEFGWGAEISSRIYEKSCNRLSAPIKRLGSALTVIPASFPLEQQVLVSKAKIENAIMEVISA